MVLLTDITYLPYNGIFAYLSTILDAYTKQILAYVLSDSLEVDFVVETVNNLIRDHASHCMLKPSCILTRVAITRVTASSISSMTRISDNPCHDEGIAGTMRRRKASSAV